MPYRRLPNTDNARIRALKRAIEKSYTMQGKGVLNMDISHLSALLRNFEAAQNLYKAALTTQVTENKKVQTLTKRARLYLSHFIQVLNLSVIRKEIKKSMKTLYGLDPDDHTVPDLMSNEALLTWGDKIIQGEQARLTQGGVPIYNPTIARVNVDFSQFKDAYKAQKLHQANTTRQLELLSSQRAEIDKSLCEVWNQVEAYYDDLPRGEKLDKCKDFGLIYYVRKREKQKAENSEEYDEGEDY